MLRGILVSVLFVANLLIAPVLVVWAGLASRCFPFGPFPKIFYWLLSGLTSTWIWLNNGIGHLAIGNRLIVSGSGELNPDDWYLLISNHQSWLDILVLYKAFHSKLPLLKFFLKRELLWQLPIAGLGCYFADYPFMVRPTREQIRKNPKYKNIDTLTTEKACHRFQWLPTTMVNFVEGTRFSATKGRKSPYKKLLRPTVGAFATCLNAMQPKLKHIVDVTIQYDSDSLSLWDFFCGKFRGISVHYEVLPISQDLLGDFNQDRNYRKHLTAWLNDRWAKKDERLCG